MPKIGKENLHAFTGNYGPPSCDRSIHQYNKWAAWRIHYRDGKQEHYCLWCFPGVAKNLPKGVNYKRLRKKRA